MSGYIILEHRRVDHIWGGSQGRGGWPLAFMPTCTAQECRKNSNSYKSNLPTLTPLPTPKKKKKKPWENEKNLRQMKMIIIIIIIIITIYGSLICTKSKHI